MAERTTHSQTWARCAMVLTNAVLAEKGKLACIDTSTGLVTKGGISTTLRPIGHFSETLTGNGTAKVLIQLFREITLQRWTNSGTDPVDVNDIGKVCYIATDTTVAETSNGGTLSVAGVVWDVSAAGVLVEMGAV